MLSRALRLAAITLLFSLNGCSLISQGTSQEVTFVSDPPGAAFTVGGVTATTPAKLVLSKKDYTIVFKKEGYRDEPYELKRHLCDKFYVSIAMGVIGSALDIVTGAWQEFDTTEINVALRDAPEVSQQITTRITSEPSDAEIEIGGVVKGRTPADVTLEWWSKDSTKDVKLSLPGYSIKVVTLTKGETRIPAILEPKPFQVTITFDTKPAGAIVQVEDLAVGQTPATVALTWTLKSPPKPVEIKLAGYQTYKAFILPDQKELQVDLLETIEETPVRIDLDPPDAMVEVDGLAVAVVNGRLPMKWTVSQGRHYVTISHPGRATQNLELVRSDTTGVKKVRLAPRIPKVP